MTEVEILRCGSVKAYLLHGTGGSVLVDTGTQAFAGQVLEACKNAGLRLIFLTHGHFDHCQNGAFLSRELHCPVGIAPADLPLVAQGEKRRVYGRGLWGRCFAGASNRNIRTKSIEPIRPEVILAGGQSLSSYGVEGKVIALPGHTAGSMGILLDSGELLAGDALMGWRRPGASWCWEDEKTAKESAELAKTLASGRIYCGHCIGDEV